MDSRCPRITSYNVCYTKLLRIIDKSLIGGAPSDVVILISAPEGSLAETFILSSPDQHGMFFYKLPADVGGMWGFEALYNGVYT